MAACYICKNTSELMRIEYHGICSKCFPEHGIMIQTALEAIAIGMEAHAQADTPSEEISAVSRAISGCQALTAVREKHGPIPDVSVDEAKALVDLGDLMHDAVTRHIDQTIFWVRERFKDETTELSRMKAYATGIEMLQSVLPNLNGAEIIDAAVAELRAERDTLKAAIICKKAELKLAHGQKKKARDLYIEASFSLRNDTSPDEAQIKMLAEIEGKITALGGRPKAS